MTHVNQRNSQPPTVHQDARPASRNRALSSVDHNFLRSQFRSLASRRLLFVGSRRFFAGSRLLFVGCSSVHPAVVRVVLARSSRVPRAFLAWSPSVRPIHLRHLSPYLERSSRVPRPHETARNRTQSHALVRNRMRPRDHARGAVMRRARVRLTRRSTRFAARSTSATSATSAARRPPRDSASAWLAPSHEFRRAPRSRRPDAAHLSSSSGRADRLAGPLTKKARRRAALAFPRAHVGTSHTSLISRPCSRRTMLCSTPHARSDEPSPPRTRPRIDAIRRLLSDPAPFAPMASSGDPS